MWIHGKGTKEERREDLYPPRQLFSGGCAYDLGDK